MTRAYINNFLDSMRTQQYYDAGESREVDQVVKEVEAFLDEEKDSGKFEKFLLDEIEKVRKTLEEDTSTHYTSLWSARRRALQKILGWLKRWPEDGKYLRTNVAAIAEINDLRQCASAYEGQGRGDDAAVMKAEADFIFEKQVEYYASRIIDTCKMTTIDDYSLKACNNNDDLAAIFEEIVEETKRRYASPISVEVITPVEGRLRAMQNSIERIRERGWKNDMAGLLAEANKLSADVENLASYLTFVSSPGLVIDEICDGEEYRDYIADHLDIRDAVDLLLRAVIPAKERDDE